MRSGKKLPYVLDASVDSTTNVIRIKFLHCFCIHRMSREDSFSETGRKSLNLFFYRTTPVPNPSIRYVTVGPGGMFPGRCSCRIKNALLGQKDKRLIRVFSSC